MVRAAGGTVIADSTSVEALFFIKVMSFDHFIVVSVRSMTALHSCPLKDP